MPETARTSKGTSTRQEILAAARRQLVETGRVVLREIADGCGIKLGNLQYYFSTQEALVLGLIEAESERDLETVHRAVECAEDPRTALRAIVLELVTRWRSDSAPIYATLNLLSLHNDVYRDLYARIYRDHYAAIEPLLAEIVPGLPKSEYEMRARLLTAVIDGAGYQRPRRRKRFADRIVEEALRVALGDADR